MRIPRKLKKKIPRGHYCYYPTGKTGTIWSDEWNQEIPTYQVKYCPFYYWNKLGYGDCKYLNQLDNGILNGEGDYSDLCLDDRCKSCGIKIN